MEFRVRKSENWQDGKSAVRVDNYDTVEAAVNSYIGGLEYYQEYSLLLHGNCNFDKVGFTEIKVNTANESSYGSVFSFRFSTSCGLESGHYKLYVVDDEEKMVHFEESISLDTLVKMYSNE